MDRVSALVDRIEPGSRVLDVGAVGHTAQRADSDDWLFGHLDTISNAVGIDILENEVSTLRQRGYDVRVADAETFTLNSQFDAIVAGELVEHLSNVGEFLDRCHEHLVNDGLLLVSTPNPWAFVHLRNAATGEVHLNSQHTCWFDPVTLQQVLDRHAFMVESYEFTPPVAAGISALLYKLGLRQLGGTHIVVEARKVGGCQ